MSKTFTDIEHQHNVFQYANGWYFFDECGIDAYGPFVTELEAYAGLVKYVREFLEGHDTPAVKLVHFEPVDVRKLP